MSIIFSVTVEDIGMLSDEEFEFVWTQLGRVVRIRSQNSAAKALALLLPAACSWTGLNACGCHDSLRELSKRLEP